MDLQCTTCTSWPRSGLHPGEYLSDVNPFTYTLLLQVADFASSTIGTVATQQFVAIDVELNVELTRAVMVTEEGCRDLRYFALRPI